MNERGFSLMEILPWFMAMLAVAAFLRAFAGKPMLIEQSIRRAQQEKNAQTALNMIANDLSQADPTAFDWTALPPQATSAYALQHIPPIRKILFDPTSSTSSYTYVNLFYQDSGDGKSGTLLRGVFDGVTSGTTTLLTQVDIPTAAEPLCHQDTTSYNLAEVIIHYHDALDPYAKQKRAVRRVAIH